MKIITPIQEKFLKAFFISPLSSSFFLTGGTALAQYYLKHRKSEDLDLFTLDQKLQFDFVNAEVLKIAKSLNFKIINQVSTGTYIQFIFESNKEILKIDLVKDVPVQFGKIKKVRGVFVDSIENIAVNRLLAIFGRTDAKDFVDLYFILRQEPFDIFELIELGRQKDGGLEPFIWASLIAEVKRLPVLPRMIEEVSLKELEKFFLELRDKILLSLKPKE